MRLFLQYSLNATIFAICGYIWYVRQMRLIFAVCGVVKGDAIMLRGCCNAEGGCYSTEGGCYNAEGGAVMLRVEAIVLRGGAKLLQC